MFENFGYKVAVGLIDFAANPSCVLTAFAIIFVVGLIFFSWCEDDSRKNIFKWVDFGWIIAAIFGIYSLSVQVRTDWYSLKTENLQLQESVNYGVFKRELWSVSEDVVCHTLSRGTLSPEGNACEAIKLVASETMKLDYIDFKPDELAEKIQKVTVNIKDPQINASVNNLLDILEIVKVSSQKAKVAAMKLEPSSGERGLNAISVIVLMICGALRLLKSLFEIEISAFGRLRAKKYSTRDNAQKVSQSEGSKEGLLPPTDSTEEFDNVEDSTVTAQSDATDSIGQTEHSENKVVTVQKEAQRQSGRD